MELHLTAKWTNGKKLFFRFICSYFIFYVIPFPGDVFPFTEFISNTYDKIWHPLVLWFAKNIFSVKTEVDMNFGGSGDKLFHYLEVFTKLLLAVVCTIAWSILDRKRPGYDKMYQWLLVIVRYYLAVHMLSYGFSKVFRLQFQDPQLLRLLGTYGSSSPMSLAWTYMGASSSYTIFTGIAEVAGGLLLLFRRTSLFGALVSAAVMSNVVMMNFSYDIPVKLFSTHMLLMSVFIFSYDIRRLVNLFFLNRTATASEPVNLVSSPWKHNMGIFCKFLFIGSFLFWQIQSKAKEQYEWGNKSPRPALYGIYSTRSFIVNSDTLKPLLTDTLRWRRLIVEKEGAGVFVQNMNDSYAGFTMKIDSVVKTIHMKSMWGPPKEFSFSYRMPKPDSLVLAGLYGNDSLQISMKKFDLKRFELLGRGFHWVNEFPYQR